jgi:O-acetylhomoserine (thiol)-lyase
MRDETLALHHGYSPDPTTKAVAVPIYQTVAYAFDDAQHGADLFDLKVPGNIYTRIMNPTQDVLEQRVAALEGGIAGLATAAGSAAITYAVLTIARAGSNVVTVPQLYGGTFTLFAHQLPALGIDVRFAPDDSPAALEALIDERTAAVYLESIGNPAGNILDLEAVSALAHEHDLPLMVDNTVASPYLVRPLEYGADIVIHSATKFLSGHGTVVAGAIVDGGRFPWSKHVDKFPGLTEPDPSYHGASYTTVLGDGIAFIIKARVQLLRDMGAAVSPDNASAVIQGIETLSLRMERHSENALSVAKWLEDHPQVASVNYAGLESSPWHEAAKKYAPRGCGAVLSFEIKGGVDAGRALVDGVSMFSHVANIGDVRSLIIHPASTTHSQLTPEQQLTAGVTPGLVRLSVGLEHLDDILADLEAGFQQAASLA